MTGIQGADSDADGRRSDAEAESVQDPILRLAIAMHHNKGAYALLLGSGVSRSAGIPTGWEITLDLVRQLAASYGNHWGVFRMSWRREWQAEPD